MLLPAAQAACAATKTNRIGVIATPATIRSSAYGKAIRNIIHSPVIIGKACPLFVPLIESGYVQRDNQVTRLVAEDYLKPVLAENVDTLILGCTHYPIIEDLIGDIAGEDVRLIDSGREAAKYVQAFLTGEHMLAQREQGECYYYVSDDAAHFAENAGVFLQDDIADHVEQIDIDRY